MASLTNPFGELSTRPRYNTRRGAMDWAIRFALEHPGSTGVVFSVTHISLDQLFNGSDGLHHCLSDRLMDSDCHRKRFQIRFPNASQIIGLHYSSDADRLRGLHINFAVAQLSEPWRSPRIWELVKRQLRPLPGAENSIIYIVDDEATSDLDRD